MSGYTDIATERVLNSFWQAASKEIESKIKKPALWHDDLKEWGFEVVILKQLAITGYLCLGEIEKKTGLAKATVVRCLDLLAMQRRVIKSYRCKAECKGKDWFYALHPSQVEAEV